MPKFSYTARNRSGKTIEETLEASSRKDALRVLTARGLQPLQVEETSSGRPTATSGKAATANERKARRKDLVSKLSRRERLPFFQSLHDLTTSGMSAGESVRLLSLRLQDPMLRTLCTGLWERLGEGSSLSQAMADFPTVFDPSSINLIQAGEATGSLNDVLGRLITHFTEQKELRRQLLTALAYPAFMLCVSGGVIIFILLFLMPRLETLLHSLGGKLPLSTQLLVGFSGFAMRYGLILIGAAVFGAITFWRWRQSKKGREKTDSWMLGLPVVGPFLVSQTVLAFSQTLSVLLENGINASEALRMTERQITNTQHRKAFKEATERVLEGEALARALQRTGFLPPLVLDQLSVGENTGNVVPSLKKIGNTYRKLISDQLNAFTKVLASIVLLGVFAFVGFIAFAVLSAVFQLSQSIKLR
ncbi:MAG: type II secretion system F family protein [Verrucomicrobia bacterium]|nr:type II secretion system F family protein [Verrucomicrobiota bacterium]